MPRPRSSTPLAESGFVDRDYFRMLERRCVGWRVEAEVFY